MNKRWATVQCGDFETREADGNLYIDGYFALFGSKYWLWEAGYETVDPGAFDLAADADVRALTNHDTTLVLGRTVAGTLTLLVDERGLKGTITINQADQDAVNLYERVKRGDVTQCSFGFEVLEQTVETLPSGVTVWHLVRVRLYEVSVVTFPAYEDTAVTARMAEAETIRARKTETWRAQMKARLKGE